MSIKYISTIYITSFLLWITSSLYYIYHGNIIDVEALFVGAFAVFLLGVAFILILFKQTRRVAGHLAFIALMCVAWEMIMLKSFWTFREYGLKALVKNAIPVVEAIKRYHADKGSFPDNLRVLVPVYLAKPPKPVLSGFPKYKYWAERDNWGLSVNANSGILNWDHFFYEPDQSNDKKWRHTPTTRIGDWLYIHE